MATDDQSITLRVEHAISGPFAPGATLRVQKLEDHVVGDRAYVFLSGIHDGGPNGAERIWYPIYGGWNEGEAPIAIGEAYLRNAPGENRTLVLSIWPRPRQVWGNPWAVDDVDAALAAIRMLFTWDGERPRVAADRAPDARAASRSDNGLLRALCEEALALERAAAAPAAP